MYAPLVCCKCCKKRAERKEIITEIVETEEKYGRDLQIILEEFCQPMLVASLLSPGIFWNLLETRRIAREKSFPNGVAAGRAEHCKRAE